MPWPFSIQLRHQKVLEVLVAGQLTTVGPRAPRTPFLPSPANCRSQYCRLNDTGSDDFPVNVSTKNATSKREPGHGRGRTSAFVDVFAGGPVVIILPVDIMADVVPARAALACEGTAGVGARRVFVAVVVGVICDRGARPISS